MTDKSRKSKRAKPLEYTDGKTHDSIEGRTKGLDELLRDNTANPFRTEVEAEFTEKLEDMNLTQMQELAVRASIFPSGNRTTLRNKLHKEFKARFRPGLKIAQSTRPVVDPDSSTAKKILEIPNSKS